MKLKIIVITVTVATVYRKLICTRHCILSHLILTVPKMEWKLLSLSREAWEIKYLAEVLHLVKDLYHSTF